MGQVARHKAAKAVARTRRTEPAYRERAQLRADERDRQDVVCQVHASLAVAEVYEALLRRAHSHNVAAGVYGPGPSAVLH